MLRHAVDTARLAQRRDLVSDFCRLGIAMALSGGLGAAPPIFKQRWPEARSLPLVMRAAVSAGTTTDSTWAGPLAPLRDLAEAFVEAVRPRTVLGWLEGVRQVPLKTRAPKAITGTSAGWIGQAQPIPVTSMAFGTVELPSLKIAAIAVITRELALNSSPAAEALIEADMIGAAAAAADVSLLDPALAAIAEVSPASITYDATMVVASGTTADAAQSDLCTAIREIETDFIAPAWIMKPMTAARLAAFGAEYFPDIGPTGGSLLGIPVITSASVPYSEGSPQAEMIVLVDGAELIVADEGAEVDVARHAALQMSETPDSPPGGSTALVSLYQSNLLGIRIVRPMNWVMRKSGAVVVITGSNYGI